MHEHIIITPVENGFVKLQAEQGYKLFSIATQRTYSEAVVEEARIDEFTAIAI